MPSKVWGPQHYNAVAKEIREELTKALDFYKHGYEPSVILKKDQASYYATEVLVKLALRFADRFDKDFAQADEGLAFDPLKFLDQCSPDEDMYPLSELWEDYINGNST